MGTGGAEEVANTIGTGEDLNTSVSSLHGTAYQVGLGALVDAILTQVVNGLDMPGLLRLLRLLAVLVVIDRAWMKFCPYWWA